MEPEVDVVLDDDPKAEKGGLMAMVKWPVITTVAIVAFIWIVFSILPAESGWRFGMRFKLFFSLFALSGGLFFIFLKIGPTYQTGSQWKAYTSIVAFYVITVGVLVALVYALPRYEIPKVVGDGEVASADERGKALYRDPAVGCYLCHAIGGSGGTRGPDLTQIAEIGAARIPAVSLEDYLRESITDPNAYVVPDYPAIMPTNFGDRLTEEQIEDLLAFLSSLR